MGNKLLTQAVLIVTAITIIMTYVRPAFGEIAEIQDDLNRFESTVSKASELNSALQSLIATEQNISAADHEKLRQYLPRSINNVVVMRDIQNIFQVAGVQLVSLSSASTDAIATALSDDAPSGSGDDPRLVFRDFNLSFGGTYEELKTVLASIEANAYPLEIVSLTFTAAGSTGEAEAISGLTEGQMQFGMILRAYALPSS